MFKNESLSFTIEQLNAILSLGGWTVRTEPVAVAAFEQGVLRIGRFQRSLGNHELSITAEQSPPVRITIKSRQVGKLGWKRVYEIVHAERLLLLGTQFAEEQGSFAPETASPDEPDWVIAGINLAERLHAQIARLRGSDLVAIECAPQVVKLEFSNGQMVQIAVYGSPDAKLAIGSGDADMRPAAPHPVITT